jgi:uncharacterized membrane protein HdeD (DUF308 family)
MSTTNTKPDVSGTYRTLEIILGLVAVAVGILALFFPTVVVVTVIVLFGIALLAIGILRVATAATSKGLSSSTRKTNALIGVLVIILASLILFFPALATATIVILLGLGLLFYGIGRIVVGGTSTNASGGLRALLIVLGILVVIFAFIVLFVPAIGVYTYAFFIAIAFILIGIDSLVSGIAGAPLM